MIAHLSVIYDCYKSPSYLVLAFITNMITFLFFVYLFFSAKLVVTTVIYV